MNEFKLSLSIMSLCLLAVKEEQLITMLVKLGYNKTKIADEIFLLMHSSDQQEPCASKTIMYYKKRDMT